MAGDAYEERRTCLVNYKYLVPSVSDIQTDTVNFSEIPDLNEYFDRYYGVALQMPTIVVEHLFDFNLTYNQIFQMRHLYTFLLYFIGCIFFYLLARCFTDSRLIALAGTAVFVLSPQILSNSLYNIKDIPFLAIFIVNLYFGIRFLRSPRSVHLLLLAMVSAICTNTRIIGAIVIFACLFIYLIKGQSEESPLKRFGKCVLCGLVCLLCYILITPVTWSSPVQAVIETLKTFSSFNVYQFNNYFMGTILDGADLPWYYLPVWIVLTTPVLFSVLSIIGLIASAVHPVKQRHIDRVDWEKLFLF